MSRVSDILKSKGLSIYSIRSDASVYEAVEAMVHHGVGSLLVVDEGDVRGIVTERDYLSEIVLRGRTSRQTLVREIMTAEVVCVEPNSSVEECMAIMTNRRIRHLPVVDSGRLVGIISIGDLVKKQAADREVEVRYLTDYITGKYPG